MTTVIRLYPGPPREFALEGLYLRPDHAGGSGEDTPRVYSNFITSLDGRIAIDSPATGEREVPRAITNARDWRLYQELAARADALLVSGRYLRELARGKAQADLPIGDDAAFDDLRQWRLAQGLAPQPAVVIVSAGLDLPLDRLRAITDRPVRVATGDDADPERVRAIETAGIRVLRAGAGPAIEGRRLVDALRAEGWGNLYAIAGPQVLKTLLDAKVLDRLYLTRVHRLIGGAAFDTLLEGDALETPADFRLRSLYHDGGAGGEFTQCFAIYDFQ